MNLSNLTTNLITIYEENNNNNTSNNNNNINYSY